MRVRLRHRRADGHRLAVVMHNVLLVLFKREPPDAALVQLLVHDD